MPKITAEWIKSRDGQRYSLRLNGSKVGYVEKIDGQSRHKWIVVKTPIPLFDIEVGYSANLTSAKKKLIDSVTS